MAFLLASALVVVATVTAEQPRSISLGADGSRLSVLTSRVLRLELGGSEDAATITFPERDSVPVPSYSHSLTASALSLKTADVELKLALPVNASDLGCERFNVSLRLTPTSVASVVCPGTATGRTPLDPAYPGVVMDSWTDIVLGTPGNLNGSVDTTDCYVGPDLCYGVLQSRMQKGLLSRDGVAVVDDSGTALWDGDENWTWRKPRTGASAASKDFYIFLHGHDYRGGLADFVALAGRTPLKPWKTHGVWWSREYPFNFTGVQDLVAGYKDHQLPLNMLVLDYQWHYGPGDVGDVKGCHQPKPGNMYSDCLNGFGGYVWNKKLFPDPVAFTDWLHRDDVDLELALNIHDPCGIDVCQEGYNTSARAAGIDPATKEAIACNMLNKTYATSLTERLLEAGDHAGVDYWWEDYGLGGPGEGAHKVECTATYPLPRKEGWGHCMHCWGDEESAKPALWSAYVHGSRLTKVGKRALLLGINGGLGHHRYPGVGSGDVYEAWNTLNFEVYLSLTAANTVTEWNHDLGGFMPGDDGSQGPYDPYTKAHSYLHNPERYARWLQAGVFQGIFRTHASYPGDPTPWRYPNFEVLQQAFQLRNALGPYIYTAAWQAYNTGVLPCHPLYYDYAEEEMAYTLSTLRGPDQPLQHSFGDDFVVSPITAAAPRYPAPKIPKACKATKAGDGLDTTASPLNPVATPDADACAAACCNNTQCSGYTFDPAQGDDSGMPYCHKGKGCCWIKHGAGATKPGQPRFNGAMFGKAPQGPSTGMTEWGMWVPPGQWVDWFNGDVHKGPMTVRRNYTEAEIPVLVRAGAIIPMKTLDASQQIAPDRLRLEVVWVPGAKGSSSVYEDSGGDLSYQKGVYSLTNFSVAIGGESTALEIIGGGSQAVPSVPLQRRYEVRFRGAPADASHWSFSPAQAANGAEWWWEQDGMFRTLVGATGLVPSNSTVSAVFNHSSAQVEAAQYI